MDKIESIKKNYYDIVLAYNLDKTLLYFSETKLQVGNLITVSIRKKLVLGCVLKVHNSKPFQKFHVKEIEEYYEHYTLDFKNIDFFKWVSEYNLCSLGLAFKLIISDSKFLKPKTVKKYKVKDLAGLRLTKKQNNFLNLIGKKNAQQVLLESNSFSNQFINNLIKKGIVEVENIIEPKNFKADLKQIKIKKLNTVQRKTYNYILDQFKKIQKHLNIKTFFMKLSS